MPSVLVSMGRPDSLWDGKFKWKYWLTTQVKELTVSPIIGIGILIILITISVGGFALFLKSANPIKKWGGLFAFGIGLFLLLLGFIWGF